MHEEQHTLSLDMTAATKGILVDDNTAPYYGLDMDDQEDYSYLILSNDTDKTKWFQFQEIKMRRKRRSLRETFFTNEFATSIMPLKPKTVAVYDHIVQLVLPKTPEGFHSTPIDPVYGNVQLLVWYDKPLGSTRYLPDECHDICCLFSFGDGLPRGFGINDTWEYQTGGSLDQLDGLHEEAMGRAYGAK
jgi:hypothetical protein